MATTPGGDAVSEQARERNARVCGKAVHPAALTRLHELFPEARVSVYRVTLEDA